MPDTEHTAFQVRVNDSIGVMARTPPDGASTRIAGQPSRVSSAVGTLRVPSLSFSRFTTMPGASAPRSSRTGTKNSARPAEPGGLPSGRARVSAISAVVAEVNHLVPDSRQLPSASWRATVSDSPTSEPPVRSVIHCPEVHAVAGSVDRSRGTARAISAWLPLSSSVRAAPSVIASGQV